MRVVSCINTTVGYIPFYVEHRYRFIVTYSVLENEVVSLGITSSISVEKVAFAYSCDS